MKHDESKILSIEESVAKAFEVDRETFYAKFGVRELCTARHFLWMLLHDEYEMSHREISKRYLHSKRMVEKAISGMRFRVENQRQDRKRYEELKNLLMI